MRRSTEAALLCRAKPPQRQHRCQCRDRAERVWRRVVCRLCGGRTPVVIHGKCTSRQLVAGLRCHPFLSCLAYFLPQSRDRRPLMPLHDLVSCPSCTQRAKFPEARAWDCPGCRFTQRLFLLCSWSSSVCIHCPSRDYSLHFPVLSLGGS